MLSVAVAIATYNRPAELERALEAWSRSTRRPDQLIVVDASDRADGRSSVERLVGDQPGGRYLAAEEPSTTKQRNQAVDEASTDVVVFCDDDTVPSSQYLAQILEVFEADPAGRIGGVAGNAHFDRPAWQEQLAPWLRAARAAAVGERYAMSRRVAYPDEVVVPPLPGGMPIERKRALNGCNMAFRTELVIDERFDEHMRGWAYGEDFDLSFRVGRHHALVRRLDAEVTMSVAHGSTVDPFVFFMRRWINPGYLIAKLDLGERAHRSLGRLLRADWAASFLLGRCPSAGNRQAVSARFRQAYDFLDELRAGASGRALVPVYGSIQERVATLAEQLAAERRSVITGPVGLNGRSGSPSTA